MPSAVLGPQTVAASKHLGSVEVDTALTVLKVFSAMTTLAGLMFALFASHTAWIAARSAAASASADAAAQLGADWDCTETSDPDEWARVTAAAVASANRRLAQVRAQPIAVRVEPGVSCTVAVGVEAAVLGRSWFTPVAAACARPPAAHHAATGAPC